LIGKPQETISGVKGRGLDDNIKMILTAKGHMDNKFRGLKAGSHEQFLQRRQICCGSTKAANYLASLVPIAFIREELAAKLG